MAVRLQVLACFIYDAQKIITDGSLHLIVIINTVVQPRQDPARSSGMLGIH